MVRNNHFTENRKTLDRLLRSEKQSGGCISLSEVLTYVRFWAQVENALIVVSDINDGKSHIIDGGFARNLNIEDYQRENSIWENKILSLMPEDEQEEKYIAELRFFHYLRHLPKRKNPTIILFPNCVSNSSTVTFTMYYTECITYLTRMRRM